MNILKRSLPLMLCAAAITGCDSSAQTAVAADSPQPETTMPSEPASTVDSMAEASAVPTPRMGDDVSSVCLTVIGMSDDDVSSYARLQFRAFLADVLDELRIDDKEADENCGARLQIDIDFEALGGPYDDEDNPGQPITCHTGAYVEGKLTFETAAGERDSWTITRTENPIEGRITACPEPKYAPFERAWFTYVSLALADIFGPQTWIPMMEQAMYPESKLEALERIQEAGPRLAGWVPKLIHQLSFGPTIPVLQFEIGEALEAITGQDFGTDAEAWEDWWSEQP